MGIDDQEDLLRFYQRELTYLRTMGVRFAEKYPKIADRLELAIDGSADPHVERLLESFAFLTARIQHHLDSEYPQISSALLDILYPQFLNPVPPMAVARFEVDPEQAQMTTGYVVEKNTPLFAESSEGQTCWFRTSYPVTLWPLEISYAGFESTDRFDFLQSAADVATVLRLRVERPGGSLKELELDRLRLYLNGEPTLVYQLYELLRSNVVRVALVSDDEGGPVFLPEDAIAPVGFGPEDAVLPYPRHAHHGYRLLQEYFTFPEKFLFLDLKYLDRRRATRRFDVLILLNNAPRERLVLDRETFSLGCAPIINLFRKTTDPIRLDHTTTEYRLVPDARLERTTEIHSILKVSETSDAAEEPKTLEPFFSFNHELDRKGHKAFWFARRTSTGKKDMPGTDLLLTFVDLDFQPQQPPTQVIFAHTLCTNRDLATKLPSGALLHIEEAAPVTRIFCLRKPTPSVYSALGGAAQWQLISHLSLNYLSLSSGQDSLKALREMLRLYSVADRPATMEQINGIRDMGCRQVVRRVGVEAWRGFCRGIEVTLTLDERAYVGNSALLFASVLSRFLSLYASVNSFSRLKVKSLQREGTWQEWPAVAGEQPVL